MANIPNSALLLGLLLFISALPFSTRGEGVGYPAQGETDLYVPVGPIEYHPAGAALGRSLLQAPFQTCRQCRCCPGGSQDNCSMMPCCYEIVCNVPGKPSGVCTFAPKACNCASCG